MSSYRYCINKQKRKVWIAELMPGICVNIEHRLQVPLGCVSGIVSSSISSPPPPTNKCLMCMAREGEGMSGCVGEYLLHYFYTLYVTRFRTFKNVWPHQDKNLGKGGGLRKIHICRKVIFQAAFKEEIWHLLLWVLRFCIKFYESYSTTLLSR